MSNPSVINLQFVAAVATGIATAQAVGGAGNLTLNGSLVSGGVATMDAARRVIITSTGADSAVVFTVVGTDRNGFTQTETVTGVTTTPVATKYDYKTVTRIGVSGATAGSISAGTNATGSSVWVVDNFLVRQWSMSVAVSPAAGVTCSVEVTYDDPNAIAGQQQIGSQQWSMSAGSQVPPHVFAGPTSLTNATADAQGVFSAQPIFAHRLTITAGTGLATMWSIQTGID